MSFWDDISDVASNVENAIGGAISTMPQSVESNWYKGPIGIFNEYKDLGTGAVGGWNKNQTGDPTAIPTPKAPPATPSVNDPSASAAANKEGDEAENHGMAANMLAGSFGSGGGLLSSSNVARNTLLGS